MDEWKMEKTYFDQKTAESAEKHKVFAKIHVIILKSVSARMIGHTAYTDIGAYNTLIVFKQRLKPTDQSRSCKSRGISIVLPKGQEIR